MIIEGFLFFFVCVTFLKNIDIGSYFLLFNFSYSSFKTTSNYNVFQKGFIKTKLNYHGSSSIYIKIFFSFNCFQIKHDLFIANLSKHWLYPILYHNWFTFLYKQFDFSLSNKRKKKLMKKKLPNSNYIFKGLSQFPNKYLVYMIL